MVEHLKGNVDSIGLSLSAELEQDQKAIDELINENDYIANPEKVKILQLDIKSRNLIILPKSTTTSCSADDERLLKISRLFERFHEWTETLPEINVKRVIPGEVVEDLTNLLNKLKNIISDIELINRCKSESSDLVKNTISDGYLSTISAELDEICSSNLTLD